MSLSKLTFVPSGGLGNRMMAIASAYTLTINMRGGNLRILWFRDWALNAPFSSIFRPLQIDNITLCEQTFKHLIFNDRPRRKNFYIPFLLEKINYDFRLNENEVYRLGKENFDFEQWATGKTNWMSCFSKFGDFDNSLYSHLFKPVSEVDEKIKELTNDFTEHTFGFHIRRTDHSISTTESPTQLFIDKAKECIDLHSDCRLFLATDDESEKQKFRHLFGTHLITSPNEASRSNIEGIRDGVSEMWALSKTQLIYGSSHSTFSMLASKIGGTPLVVLKRIIVAR